MKNTNNAHPSHHLKHLQITAATLLLPDLSSNILQVPGAAANVLASMSEAFHNKQAIDASLGNRKWNTFYPRKTTVGQLAAHILSGKAWMPQTFDQHLKRGGRSTAAFEQASLVALDFDDGVSVTEALAVPIVRECAMLVHPSASSSEELRKTRVIFQLTEPLETAERFRWMVHALALAVGMKPDEASWKPAQPYFGSTNRSDVIHFNPRAVLNPADIAGELADIAAEEMQRIFTARERVDMNLEDPYQRNRAGRYAQAAIQHITEEYLAVPGGTGLRHSGYAKFAAAVWSRRDWLSGVDVESHIIRIGEQTARSAQEIQDMLNWVRREVQNLPLSLPDKTPAKRNTIPIVNISESLKSKRCFASVPEIYREVFTRIDKRAVGYVYELITLAAHAGALDPAAFTFAEIQAYIAQRGWGVPENRLRRDLKALADLFSFETLKERQVLRASNANKSPCRGRPVHIYSLPTLEEQQRLLLRALATTLPLSENPACRNERRG